MSALPWFTKRFSPALSVFRSVRFRIFAALALLGITVAAVVGMSLLAYVSRSTRQEYIDANRLTLANLATLIDVSLIDNIEGIYQKYISEPQTAETLGTLISDPLAGNHAVVLRIRDILLQTFSRESYYSQIKDVLVFYPKNEIAVSAKGFKYLAESDVLSELSRIESSLLLHTRIRFYHRLYAYGRQSNSHTAFVFRFPYHISDEYALIFVVLRNDFLDGILARTGIQNEIHNFAILDEHGNDVYVGSRFQDDRKLFSASDTVETYLKNGWSVHKYVDFEAYHGRISIVRKIFVATLCAAAAVAVLLSVLLSKRIYNPLGRIVGRIRDGNDAPGRSANEFTAIENELTDLNLRVEELETTVEKNAPAIKANFIRDLVAGEIDSYEVLTSRSSLVSMSWNYDRYRCIIFELSGESMRGLDSQSSHFALYHLMDNAERLMRAEGALGSSAVECEPNMACAVIGYALEMEECLESIIRRVLADAEDNLEIRTSAYVGNAVTNPLDVHQSYTQALTASEYGYGLTDRRLIPYDSVRMRHESDATIAPTFVAELEAVLRTHDIEAVRDFLVCEHRRLIAGDHPAEEFHHFAHEIRRCLQNHAQEVFYDVEIAEGEDSVTELIGLVVDAERSIIDYVHQRENDGYGPTIMAVCRHIDKHVGDLLSLDAIADLFDIPATSLSRYFKKVTGENFLAYVTERRMEHAKKLLRDSNTRIKDVAGKCGFNSDSYFIYQFKSRFGYTPSTFQKLARVRSERSEETESDA